MQEQEAHRVPFTGGYSPTMLLSFRFLDSSFWRIMPNDYDYTGFGWECDVFAAMVDVRHGRPSEISGNFTAHTPARHLLKCLDRRYYE